MSNVKCQNLIAIHAPALLNRRTGVENYLWNLTREWENLKSKAELVYYSPRSLGKNFAFPNKVLAGGPMWTQGRLSLHFLKNKPDVLFVPAHILPRVRGKKTVVTIHGLEYERLPEYYPLRQRKYLSFFTREAAKKADQIITVSENTKKDLIELYNIFPEKIKVIHHGVNKVESNVKCQMPSVGYRYFLYLGRLESKKNIERIVMAFREFKKKHPEYRLILSGPRGFGYNKSWRMESGIIETGYIHEIDKDILLKGAKALLFPSLYEGFGMPVLEAQSIGTPVITSNISSLPEVAGEGAYFVNPLSVSELKEAMLELVENDNLAADLIRTGYRNARRFSWKKCARGTLNIIKKS